MFRCVPACISCRTAGECSKPPLRTSPAVRPSPSADWAPNRLPMVRLKCGCLGLPWPIFKEFGSSIEQIICDLHGPTTITKREAARFKKIPTEFGYRVVDHDTLC